MCMTPEQLRSIADQLTANAAQLRQQADEMDWEQGEGELSLIA